MLRNLIVFLLILTFGKVFSQKPAYLIYNAEGEKVSYKMMIEELAQKDIVLFGEQHNNPISHWLQFEVTADLIKTKSLILGAEMFEADNQTALNDFLNGSSTAEKLDSTARLWPNYKTDYKPLVDFAKEKELAFIATNIPRRFAKLVYKEGFEALDSLSAQEKEWLAPLPIAFDPELPSYKNILQILGDHGTAELVKAQAIKDATMAYFILKNYKKDQLFMHYNGTYHSDKYEGILWYLKKERNDLTYASISTVSQEKLNKLEEENLDLADFIIVIDSHMTSTY